MLNELLKALSNKDFVTARTCMESLLQDKIAEKIEEKKLEVTEQMFNVKESCAPYKAGQKVKVDGKLGEISHVRQGENGDHKYKITDLGANDPYKQKRLENGNFINHSRVTPVNEDIEQIDEISSATVTSYLQKAPQSIKDIRKKSLDSWDKYMSASNGNVRRKNAMDFEKHQDKAENRAKMVGKAAMRLAKEDLDNVDTGLCEAKIDGPTAIKILNQAGGSTSDFHELGSAEVDTLLHHAKIHKYRKSPNAPGSTARMFHQHLTKIARRHADGYDGPSWK